MSIKRGEITTKVIKNGLVFNMDAANRASTTPVSNVETSFNTVDISISGAFSDNGIFDSSTITPSFAFGGTDDYIETSYDSTGVTGFSITSWAKANSYGSYNSIASQWRASSTTSSWVLESVSNKMFFYVVKSGGFSYAGGNTTISAGQWYNFSAVWDSSSQVVTVYINGVPEATTVTGLTTWATTNVNTVIGALYNNAGTTIDSGLWIGDIGPIQIYNRALSAEEVLYNYNGLKSRFGL